METMNTIARRRSVRAYQPRQLDEADLNAVLAAGGAAPVGMGDYTALHLTAIQGGAALARLSAAAGAVVGQSDPLYGAPAVLLVSSREDTDPGIAYVNAACVLENMLLAGADRGVGSVIVWSTALAVQADPALRAALGIPEGYQATVGAAFGYPRQADEGEKDLKLRSGLNRV